MNNSDEIGYSVVGRAFSATCKFMLGVAVCVVVALVYEVVMVTTGLAKEFNVHLTFFPMVEEMKAGTLNLSNIIASFMGTFTIFFAVVFAVNLNVKYKHKKRLKTEKKADDAIDYASKSDEYRKNEVNIYDYENTSSHLGSSNTEAPAPTGTAQVDEEIVAAYAAECQQSTGKKENIKDKHIFMKKGIFSKGMLLGIVSLIYLLPKLPALLKEICLNQNITMLPKFIMIIAVVIAILIVIDRRRKMQLAKDSIVYTKIVPNAVKKAFGENSSYDKSQGISGNEIARINCFSDKITNIIGSSRICGRYKNVEFCSAHEVVMGEYIDDDGDKREYAQFKGLIVSLPYPKSSKFRLGLRSNSREDIIKAFDSKKHIRNSVVSEINETESTDFNTLFTINSENEENLYYILTPHIMEKIAALYKHSVAPKPQPVYSKENSHTQNIAEYFNAYYQSGIYKRMYIYFENGRIYLGFNTKKNFLEYQKVNPTKEELTKLQGTIVGELNEVRKLLDLALSLY